MIKIVLTLVPLLEQKQIVSEIERHFSIADSAEKAVDVSLKEAERLRQSILKQAFEGKLVKEESRKKKKNITYPTGTEEKPLSAVAEQPDLFGEKA